MDGRYLLDSNIVIAALSSDADVLKQIDDADQCFISAIVLGEMLYGALNSANTSSNLDRLNAFMAGAGHLFCDQQTARLYGEIKTSLRQKGKPIPDNDIWIAATAQQHSLTLVTRDLHFGEVVNIKRTRW